MDKENRRKRRNDGASAQAKRVVNKRLKQQRNSKLEKQGEFKKPQHINKNYEDWWDDE